MKKTQKYSIASLKKWNNQYSRPPLLLSPKTKKILRYSQGIEYLE